MKENCRINTVNIWKSFGASARKISTTHYRSLIELIKYCKSYNIEPRHVNDEVMIKFRATLIATGSAKAQTHFRSSIKYWNNLARFHGFSLSPLAPTDGACYRSSTRWSALPPSLTEALVPFIGPIGPEDPPTRHKTNIANAIVCVADAALAVMEPADLLSVDALDAIAEAITTNAKRESILASLAALAKALGDDAAHERVRSTIRAEVDRSRTINAAISIEVDRAMSTATLQRLEFHLTGVVLTLANLKPGGRIERQGKLRPLTRRTLLPRAQDAMAAIAVLQTRVRLSKLSKYRFEVPIEGICSLVFRADDEPTKIVRFGTAASALLDRLRHALLLHSGSAPQTLFDMSEKPGRARCISDVRRGIAELLEEAGVPLTLRGLGALSERLVAGAAASLGEAAVGTGKRRADDFERRQGCDFAATAAWRFAQHELADDDSYDARQGYEHDSIDLLERRR